MRTTTKSLTESERAFLQRRVAAFGAVAGGSFGFFLLFRLGLIAVLNIWHELTHPSMLYHLLAALCFGSAWVLCRGKLRSVRYVRAVETLAMLTGVVATAMMGAHIALVGRPDYILLLALTYAVLARSIWVPSPARRTALLSAMVGAEIVIGQYVTYSTDAALEFWTASMGEASTDLTPHGLGMFQAANVAAWWVLTSFIATATSKVIYGLRRDVRDAKRLGQYQLEAKLGEGGMGVVYRAKHALLQRPTAVKLLRPEKAGAASLERFEKEVQQTARLTHPNIITIFDYGHTADGVFYYAMEYIDGATLDQAIKQDGAMPAGRVLYILQRVAAALVEAHGVGLIHRDIKPANVLLFLPHDFGGVADGVKLLDFGLVKELDQEGSIALTSADTISGTPQYMAPEAIRDPASVDGRSDIYAVGAVGYYLLTGHHVFDGANIVEVCGHHLHTIPDPPSSRLERPVPEKLEQVIMRCLAKDPAERPQSARDLEQLLNECPVDEEWTPTDAERWWARWRTTHEATQASTTPSRTPLLTIDVARDTELRTPKG
jgi:serine/threonine-protein kinase